LDHGVATLRLKDICSVFDAFTVPNSFDPAHALGFVSAVVNSLRIDWNCTNPRHFSSAASRFAADFKEGSATIAVTVTTPSTAPPFTPAAQHGFQFTANPATSVTDFAQIGQERNGALFS